MTDRWAKPQEIDAVTAAFSARVVGELMPKRNELPEEFQSNKVMNRSDKWTQLFSRLFYGGKNDEDLRLFPKDGIDPQAAFRQIRTCMGSFEPKHEHKIGACCFLFSNWFNDYQWVPKEGDTPSVFFVVGDK